MRKKIFGEAIRTEAGPLARRMIDERSKRRDDPEDSEPD
jgi:hypothetical protein